MKKILIPIIAVLTVVGFVIPQVSACECKSLTFDDHLMDADVVFQGTILREPVTVENNFVTSFSAIDVFKRPPPEFDHLFNRGRVNVTTGIDSGICGVDFQAENTYIVFGTISEDKIYTTSCSGTAKIDNYFEQMLRLQHYDSSPYEQFKSGVHWFDVTCAKDRVIVVKTTGLPACVSLDTAIKLYKRGWAQNMENNVWYDWAKKVVREYFDSKLAKIYNIEDGSVSLGLVASRESLPPHITIGLQFTSLDVEEHQKTDHLFWFGVNKGDNIDKILELSNDGKTKTEIAIER